MYKIGLGFDVHRLIKNKNKKLILGGAIIPVEFCLEAISDGDVLLHSISDAILGAASLGDIGDFFPPSKKYLNINSREIVEFVLNKIKKRFKIINIDTTIIAQKPRLSCYKKDILKSLKDIFKIGDINIKIKSKEELNILGGKNSIACFSIVLLKNVTKNKNL